MTSLASKNAGMKPKRRQGGKGKPIQPGQVLNPHGRAKGSRQKLSEGFITVLAADFDKHGEEAVRKMRTEKPEAYVRVVADLVPKDFNLNHNASDAFLELWKHMSGKGD